MIGQIGSSVMGLSWQLITVMAILAVTMTVVVVILIRRRQLREKYVTLWIGAGLVLVSLSIPPVAIGLAALLGVAAPSNLVFFAVLALLLGVALHLSWECSTLEEEVRTLAEEAALARHDLETMQETVARLEAAVKATGRHPQ